MKEKTITLPKLKKVRIRGYRKLQKLPGRILNATIKQVGILCKCLCRRTRNSCYE